MSAASRTSADHGHARDLAVHGRPSIGICATEFARWETSRRPASRTKFATTLEPP